ncbi:MAG: hypothetical protein WC584_03670 [Candidatus Pacearchaeota archaeon]
MGKKKRGIKTAIAIITIIICLSIAAFFLFQQKDEVNLSPSQPIGVQVQIGNSAPTITNVQAIPNVNLNPSPSTTNIIFTFTARDSNGASDLVDSTASAQFINTGEPTRTGTCIFLSTAGKEKTYRCTVVMNYFDKSGSWTAGVSVADTQVAIATSSTIFTVNLLRDISLSPPLITFPSVSPGNSNVLSTQNTLITNNGNFEAPPGTISATAYDLTGETNPLEKIPAANFKIAGSLQSNTCGLGEALIHSSTIVLTTSKLSRGQTGNTETIKYCLTSVPEISSQFYSAIGGNSWIIAIN